MKTLNHYIAEKLVINRNSKVIKHKYQPKTSEELKELIYKLIDERGEDADLNDIDVSKITDMSKMFYESKFTGDISGWDVSNVTNMRWMFSFSIFNGDISDWDVSKVENFRYTFYNSEFNGDISNWNINNVIDMENMFTNCPIKEEYKPNI